MGCMRTSAAVFLNKFFTNYKSKMQRFQRGSRGNFRGNDRGGRGGRGRGRGDRKREWINPTERYNEDEPPVK